MELDTVGCAEESADPGSETCRDLGLLICPHHWMGGEEQEQRDGIESEKNFSHACVLDEWRPQTLEIPLVKDEHC